MSISKREDVRRHFPGRQELRFDPEGLARELEARLSYVEFAFLLGSGAEGVIPRYSDLDLAVFVKPELKVTFDVIAEIMGTVEETLNSGIEVDVGVLNSADVVFRFEALRGRHLFVRPAAMERYVEFYCRTCQEYEDYMFMLERYYRNRREIAGGQAA